MRIASRSKFAGLSGFVRIGAATLVFKMGDGEIRWHKPVVYQEKDGARQLVAARLCHHRAEIAWDSRSRNMTQARPLYIDPVTDTMIYSTYLGREPG